MTILKNGKKIASGKIARGMLTFNRGKPVLLAGGDDYRIVVANTDKGKSASDYSFALVADRLFDKGENGDDTWQNAVDITPTTAPGTTPIADGWVGYGDATDLRKFTLSGSAALVFSVRADDSVKFTLCRLNGSRLKTLQTLKVKSSGAMTTATASKRLLVEAGTYYLCVTSTNAAKGGDADYSVSLLESSVFFPTGDRTNDTWRAAENNAKSELGETLSGWVGYGDATDFHGIITHEEGRLTFDLDAATAEAFRRKEVKFSLVDGSGRKVALTALDGDTLVTKKAVAAGSCYLGVSCANVRKYDTSYGVVAGMLA